MAFLAPGRDRQPAFGGYRQYHDRGWL